MAGMEILMVTLLVTGVAGLLAWMHGRYPARTEPLVEAIDAILPQTQCGQCGYPGCRPYAEAVAAGAALDLCPPGGAETQQQLARLLGRDPGLPLATPRAVTARIDESSCIGCFLCVEACPVDAIVGAPRYLHTVIEERCTGCELCLPPCPVDCIDLVPLPAAGSAEAAPAGAAAAHPVVQAGTADCIRCGRCDPACPEALPVARLWWVSRSDDLTEAVAAGLDDCIECGLCNPPCPSELDLVGTFKAARVRLAESRRAAHAADKARQHVAERAARLEREAVRAADRRRARLAALQPGKPHQQEAGPDA